MGGVKNMQRIDKKICREDNLFLVLYKNFADKPSDKLNQFSSIL